MSGPLRFVCQGCGCIIDMHDSEDWVEHWQETVCCRASVKYMNPLDFKDKK